MSKSIEKRASSRTLVKTIKKLAAALGIEPDLSNGKRKEHDRLLKKISKKKYRDKL